MAGKLPRAFADMQLTAVRTLTGPPPAPVLQALVTGTTAALNWTAPVVLGQSVIANYALWRASNAAGPFTQIATPVSLSASDIIAGTQFYRVQAIDQFGPGALSNTVACSPVSGLVKFHGGYYGALDAVSYGPVSLGSFSSIMDSCLGTLAGFGPQDHILGWKFSPTWGALEGAQGDYSAGFALFDAILARLRSNYNLPKRLVANVLTFTFGRGIASSNDGSVVPKYILQNAALYGPTPYSGVTSGVWGANSGGLSTGGYAGAIWRQGVMDRYIALVQAYGARYDSDPLFECWSSQEIFGAVNGFANGDLGADDGPMTIQAKRLFQASLAAWPTTNVCHQNTDMRTQPPTIALEQYMMANRINPSSADTTGHSKNTTSLGNWGLDTYAGKLGSGGDQRASVRSMMDVEAPDLGAYGFGTRFFNGNPQDTIDGLNLDHQASHAWIAVITAATNCPPACVWSALSPLLASHPLVHVNYPGNYPQAAMPLNFEMTHQGQNDATLQWTAVSGVNPNHHYQIWRGIDSGTGATLARYATSTATSYTDNAATNITTPGFDPQPFGPATVYRYGVSAVDSLGNESAIQTQLMAWIFRNGTDRWQMPTNNYNSTAGTIHTNDTSGSPQNGAPFDVKVDATAYIQPFSCDPFLHNMSPTSWCLELGGFDYMTIDIKPTVANQTFQLNLISRITSGDNFNSAQVIVGGADQKFGPQAQAGVWATYRIPFRNPSSSDFGNGNALQMGFGKFTGSISGSTLTVTAMVSGINVQGSAYLSGTGVTQATGSSTGTYVGQTSGLGGGVGSYPIVPAQSVASTLISAQRTNLYKFSLFALPSGDAYYCDNVGFGSN